MCIYFFGTLRIYNRLCFPTSEESHYVLATICGTFGIFELLIPLFSVKRKSRYLILHVTMQVQDAAYVNEIYPYSTPLEIIEMVMKKLFYLITHFKTSFLVNSQHMSLSVSDCNFIMFPSPFLLWWVL
ncbi:hypothetical protein mRhiFer1_009965 [Rhinolophus ferrumequinum]|uniref:Uncharacterized protein n=1 Tax=Rhinolophus ferrumequinum TaxID=59479 RepID=A0A7J7YIR1_RHIFE|nr:hypothetical protein mRhiFer1_009965 [Rhinolophus ferrumequinum]